MPLTPKQDNLGNIPQNGQGVRHAASLIVLSDTAHGLSVLMIRKKPTLAFAGGAWVFPGGQIDPSDFDDAHKIEKDIEQAARLGALRECFEETGLLLVHENGETRALEAALPHQRDWQSARTLPIAHDHFIGFARWQPPPHLARRYDTRFFMVACDNCPRPLADGGEADDAMWQRPKDILAQAADNQQKLLYPTFANLTRLAKHETVASARAEAITYGMVNCAPEVREIDGKSMLVLPPNGPYRAAMRPLD